MGLLAALQGAGHEKVEDGMTEVLLCEILRRRSVRHCDVKTTGAAPRMSDSAAKRQAMDVHHIPYLGLLWAVRLRGRLCCRGSVEAISQSGRRKRRDWEMRNC